MAVVCRHLVLLGLMLAAHGLALADAAQGQVAGEAGSPASAEARPEPAFPVAIIRLDKIFKENAELQKGLAPLKAEAAELEKTIQVRQTEIESTQAKLQRTQQGSPDFEKLQLQLARLRTELQLTVNRERQKLQTREGQVYLAVFRDLETVVAAYCKERGIRLVLRHQDGVEGNNVDPKAVLSALNRGVVYEENLDITADIARLLAERGSRPD